MATGTGQAEPERLSEKSLKKLENSVLYALAATSSKLTVPAGTRIWSLYSRTLADLYINEQRKAWMWEHIAYGISLTKGAKRVDPTAPAAKNAKSVKDVWAAVLAVQPGAPKPQEDPGTDHA